MKTERLLILLTAVNVGLFSYQMVRPRPSTAATTDVQTVIRGRALEIVDDRGRVRASLSVLPEDPKHMWKGEPYPETVLLRLMSPDGRPNVKLGASKRGAADQAIGALVASSLTNPRCAGLIFRSATVTENHSARSTSGNC